MEKYSSISRVVLAKSDEMRRFTNDVEKEIFRMKDHMAVEDIESVVLAEYAGDDRDKKKAVHKLLRSVFG